MPWRKTGGPVNERARWPPLLRARRRDAPPDRSKAGYGAERLQCGGIASAGCTAPVAGHEEIRLLDRLCATAFVKLTRKDNEELPRLIAELIERRPDCLDPEEAAIVVTKVALDLMAMLKEVFSRRLFEATLAEFDLSNPEELRRWDGFVAAANALAKDRRPSE